MRENVSTSRQRMSWHRSTRRLSGVDDARIAARAMLDELTGVVVVSLTFTDARRGGNDAHGTAMEPTVWRSGVGGFCTSMMQAFGINHGAEARAEADDALPGASQRASGALSSPSEPVDPWKNAPVSDSAAVGSGPSEDSSVRFLSPVDAPRRAISGKKKPRRGVVPGAVAVAERECDATGRSGVEADGFMTTVGNDSLASQFGNSKDPKGGVAGPPPIV
jgi:hypothetical protein